tara:strand:+ start:4419 stop:5411 length:993 start_codon:yes stop_codon:yes gene_type:complete
MSSVLTTLKDFNEDNFVLKKHPLVGIDLESKIIYLTGLCLVMNADDKILGTERKYIATLIRTFDLPDKIIMNLEKNAAALDKIFIDDFKSTLLEKNLVNTFFYDAVMICFQDDNYCISEKSVIEEFKILFDTSDKDLKFIERVVQSVSSKNIKQIECIKCEKLWQWEHLTEYHRINHSHKIIKISTACDLLHYISTEPYSVTIELGAGVYRLTEDDFEKCTYTSIVGDGTDKTTILLVGIRNVLQDDEDHYNQHSHEFNISRLGISSIKNCNIDSLHHELLVLTTYFSDSNPFEGSYVPKHITIDDATKRCLKQINEAFESLCHPMRDIN